MTVSTNISSAESSSPSASNEINIPHEYICPTTQEIMKNPLMSRYGQTYERDAILTWISKHNNLCPLTRQVLLVSDLIRHGALKSRIEVWKKQNGMIECADSFDGDDETPSILLTCRASDLLSNSDHNPKKQSDESEEENQQQQQHRQQRRLGQRILRLIRSSR